MWAPRITSARRWCAAAAASWTTAPAIFPRMSARAARVASRASACARGGRGDGTVWGRACPALRTHSRGKRGPRTHSVLAVHCPPCESRAGEYARLCRSLLVHRESPARWGRCNPARCGALAGVPAPFTHAHAHACTLCVGRWIYIRHISVPKRAPGRAVLVAGFLRETSRRGCAGGAGVCARLELEQRRSLTRGHQAQRTGIMLAPSWVRHTGGAGVHRHTDAHALPSDAGA